MRFSVDVSKVQGELYAPTSKSYTHRAIAIGALSSECIVRKPLLSADTLATVAACEKLGAKIELINGDLHITGIKGKPGVPDDVIDVKNSGTTLRLMTAISSLANGATVLTGDSSIRGRPNQPLLDVLNKMGVEVFSTRNNGCAPIVVRGGLKGSAAEIDGSMSSQFISALLIACPLAEEDTILSVKGQMKSRPYVDITIEMLAEAGVRILVDENNGIRLIIPANQKYDLKEYTVPGDFSSASYLLAAAAMLGPCISVHNLFPSKQGDSEIINVLRQMGADVHWDTEKGIVTVKRKTLKGIMFDAGATPDLVPTVAVLAAVADGVTVIDNAKHVRYKETDRLHAMALELSKMGIMVKEEPDSLTITGGKLIGAAVHGWHDHRIVMALTLAGMVAGNTTIDTAESVSISYPDFFEEMKSIGAKIETLDG
ncbi:MAG: 3-phosphoshikimate 1-carboxyvinyltransferase [Methanomethylovorans sp. PtaU1.Bin093]|uniref:3-phosphoshikimate 1-carboxyvinyltransferase n=1 Tax=Methanomethylovorans sp. PtaU1.Bin093 TaxID=1811679 RepID=UPI0009CCD317|nr:3-phosphoshikimate 1-carboxyvinyltransferase [Methanomethylovorans sp. PtaU1.Bin093]OPY22173.1 MAG: 3-phosphoshikimate 1-carboxyvinyltransferase [Methanomethylovorans sp. PtaU1.Bin093]